MGTNKFTKLLTKLRERMSEKDVKEVLGYELNEIDDEMLSKVFGGVSVEQLGNMSNAELQKFLEERGVDN